MAAEKKRLSVKEAFRLAQQPHQNQAKLVVALSRTYSAGDDKTAFQEEFVHYLKYALVVYKREPAVERVIDFAAKFVTSFHQSDQEEEEEEDGGILNYLFTFLLKSHEANSSAVRFRVCQLINKLLGSMPENAQIDDDLFDKINEAMLIRLKDKIPNVRIQAVLALSRLQDPKDDDCPVVDDAVRQAVQKHLLQGWLRFTEGNILELLHRLDVENSSDVAVSVLNSLFSVTPLSELVGICKNNDDRKLIPVETLTPELALYWRTLCEYLKSKGDEGEEFLEQILPEPVVYAEYLLRKRLLAILQETLTLPTTPISLVTFIVEILLHIILDDNKRIQIVTEIISEIRAPIVTVRVDPSDTRKKELKMAEIKVKLIEAKEALENCIAVQDFDQASKLKEEIKTLEDAKINLLKETEQLEIKEVHTEKNDAETLQKCLILCYELLKQISISAGIGATMNGIIESLVLQIDDVTIKISALKAIFDQLMTFGIEPFKTKKAKTVQCEGADVNSGDEEEAAEDAEETATAKNVLKLLTDFLDSEVSELRTGAAEGLAKLMFSGLLVSSRILSRLILLWYNPVTEEDVQLRHCLGVFFPMFAFASRTNQECFEEAFFPTLQTLASAPASSPLAEVDVTNVAELLIDLTRPSRLNPQGKNSQDYQALTVHDNLAIKICNEILTSPCKPENRVYTKALSSIELSSSVTKDLLLLLDEILEQVTDRTCLRALEKIKNQLEKGTKELDQAVVAQDQAQGTSTTTALQNEDGNHILT
ncbi:hypothetical protein ACRRTK_014749 [Alexandromys fortis]